MDKRWVRLREIGLRRGIREPWCGALPLTGDVQGSTGVKELENRKLQLIPSLCFERVKRQG